MRIADPELIALTEEFSTGEGLFPTEISALQISRSSRPTTPIHTVYRPCFCLILQGEKVVTVGGKSFTYCPTDYLVSSVDLPVTGQVTVASRTRPYLCLVIEIDPATVYDILSAGQVDSPSPLRRGIYVERVNEDLLDASLRLLRTLRREVDRKVLAPGILRELTYRLLESSYCEPVRQLGVAGSQMRRISKSIEHLNRNYAKTLRMEDLARLSKMSPSALYLHFKTITAMSPLQYQKTIRLQEARRILSTELTDAASVAYTVGYESPSQFSREYARMFGAPPMIDIKNQRSKQPPA